MKEKIHKALDIALHLTEAVVYASAILGLVLTKSMKDAREQAKKRNEENGKRTRRRKRRSRC
jgi:hypothetical protein